MGTWSYVYDAAVQLRRQVDAIGQETRYNYDQLGRMISREESEDGAAWDPVGTWVYDTAAATCLPGGAVTGTLTSVIGADGYQQDTCR